MFELDRKDVLAFKNKYLNKNSFNVLLITNCIDDWTVDFLSDKNDVEFYTFKFFLDLCPNIVTNKIKILEPNDFKEYSTAIKALDLIISDNNKIIELSQNLNKITLKITDKKSLAKIKYEIKSIRLQAREKYILNKVNQIEKNVPLTKSSLMDLSFLYESLFETTYKHTYIEKQIDILKNLTQLDSEYSIKYLSDIAVRLGHFTNQTEEAQNIWTNILDKIVSPDILYCYSCFQLSQQNFDEYFKYFDTRFITKYQPVKYPHFNKPKWKGEQCTQNKTLLIHYEEGFGDIILFSGYINDIKNLFKKIIFVIKPELKDLIQNSFPNVIVKTDINNIKFDYHVPLFCIPGILKKYPTNDKRDKWIKSDNQKVKEYTKYFDNNKFNIGIFYDSTKNFIKRFSDLETFMPLAYIDNVQLYSLHIDKEDIELNYIDDNVHIENLGKHFKNFSDTAGAIENCDLIIATDSSVLNLAGAMGKKTFGLFPEFAEYRWYKLEGEDVGWYKSVKPFHAKHENDFKPEIAKICEEIKELVKQKFNN